MENTGDQQWADPNRPIGQPPFEPPPFEPPAGRPVPQPPAGQPPFGQPPFGQPVPQSPFGQPAAQPSFGQAVPPSPGQPVPSASPWPGYGMPPAPPPPPAKSPRRVIALVVTLGVLFVACAGFGVFGAVRAIRDNGSDSSPSFDGRPAAADPTGSKAAPSATPHRPVGVTGKVPAGSKASTIKLRKNEDLERVCDRWYYPKSPKYTTSVSPHPIVISVRDRKDLDFRSVKGYVGTPYDAPAKIKAAWEPKSPSSVQLVACVDLVTIGSKVKSCKIDKPKPSSIVMKEGTYRLSLYEVATRRKIFETKLTGENESCPLLILIGDDRAVYSTLEDEQLVDALRRFVEE
jgi:hypothetical protein